MELSYWVVMVLSAQVQRQTNKTASEMLSSCLKFKSLPSLKPITTIKLKDFRAILRKRSIPGKFYANAQTEGSEDHLSHIPIL